MTDDPIAAILARDNRYKRGAYDFVKEALHTTVSALEERRHVTAAELLEGIRKVATEQFGPLARTVLEELGVHTTADFGNIVFNMVEAGELGKTDEDDIADFADVYSFDEVFPPVTGEVRVLKPEEADDV